jgi:hypothetical protein
MGLDDKRQMTVFLGAAASGDILPPQLIYQGTTKACHPKEVDFPDAWDINHTDSHWSKEKSVLDLINNVLVPYITKVKTQLGKPVNSKSLLIWDVYKSHRTHTVLKTLEKHHICVVFIPACCTSELQPLDLVINRVFKHLMAEQFSNWYASQVASQLGDEEDNVEMVKVQLQLSVIKPLHAGWLMESISRLSEKHNLVYDAFEKAGIMDVLLGIFLPEHNTVFHLDMPQTVTAEEANDEGPPSDEESVVSDYEPLSDINPDDLDNFDELTAASDSEDENL